MMTVNKTGLSRIPLAGFPATAGCGPSAIRARSARVYAARKAPALCAGKVSAETFRPGNLKSLALISLRSAYRTFRPALGPGTCRFEPSCSDYAFQALDKHGILKGTKLAAGRLSRCRPFSPGGYDPVP